MNDVQGHWIVMRIRRKKPCIGKAGFLHILYQAIILSFATPYSGYYKTLPLLLKFEQIHLSENGHFLAEKPHSFFLNTNHNMKYKTSAIEKNQQ